jgi:PAS domain S-box-containing protein
MSEEAILAANQKLALHFEQTPLAVIEWDKKFCVVRWNPAAESIFGFSAAEAIGQHATFIIPEAAHPFVAPVLQQLLQGSGGVRSTNENLRKGGELILCEWYNTSLRDASGQVLGVASQVQDITERKRAEDALQRQQAMLGRTEAIAHVGSWEWEVATDTVTWSDEMFRILQRNPADGAPSFAKHALIYPPEDMTRLQQAVMEALSKGVPFELELRTLRPDGEARTCLARGYSRRDSAGMVTHLVGSLQDITDRKRLEIVLEESEKHFRLLSENSSDGVALFENDKVKYVSESYLKISGYEKQEITNISFEDIFKKIQIDDAIRIKKIIENAHFQKLTQFHYQYRMLHKNGTYIWVEDNINVEYDHDGNHLRSIIHSRDITDRKRAEEALRESESRFRKLFELHSAVKLVIDPEAGNIIDANAAAAKFYGWSVEQLKQMCIQQINTLSPEAIKIEMEQARSSGRIHFEFRHRRADGSIRDVEVFSNVVETMGKELLFSIIIDITERKQLEAAHAALETQNRQLQKAESLGLMAASIAHHFNNKLQSVMACLDVLSLLPKGLDPTKHVALAKQATTKAAEVSKQMLLYLGHSPGIRKPRFLAEICRHSLPRLQDCLPSTVTLATECPGPGPVIRANGDQILQVLTNLVTNACEAMGDSGGRIQLGVRTCPAGELPTAQRFPIGWQPQGLAYACLEVADTGCGIAAADIEKVFDPFFSTKFTGRGLGLPVALGIVQAHGGAIAVESRPGAGSVFRIIIPLSTEAMPRQFDAPVQAAKSAGGGTILLVDDDELLLMTAGPLIEMAGFEVLTAKDGLEALDVFRQHQGAIRCVLTDLTMPRLDGWGLLTALRQLDPNLPVILASGFDQAQVLASTHPDRPQAFLGKPYDLQQLHDALGQALVTRS